MGLLTAVLARALALHSRQGREPLRGNIQSSSLQGAAFRSSRRGGFPASPRGFVFGGVPSATRHAILAVGAEALPVTPSGGALFAS